ncbi:MAG: hypothetical protein AAF492_30715, partial [Verrucomicrobiota bacterium]
NQPVARLSVDASQKEFARRVRLDGRNADTNDWVTIANGEVHRLGPHEKLYLNLDRTLPRYLKCIVFHRDDQPIPGFTISAQTVPEFLVFEAGSGQEPTLYYGSPGVPAPGYDLSRRISEAEAGAALPAGLQPRVANDAFAKPFSFGRYGNWLAAAAVGLVSLVVIRVVVGMMRDQASEPTS